MNFVKYGDRLPVNLDQVVAFYPVGSKSIHFETANTVIRWIFEDTSEHEDVYKGLLDIVKMIDLDFVNYTNLNKNEFMQAPTKETITLKPGKKNVKNKRNKQKNS